MIVSRPRQSLCSPGVKATHILPCTGGRRYKMAWKRQQKKGGPGLAREIRKGVFSWVWREPRSEIPHWHVPLNVAMRILYIVIEQMRIEAITLRARGLTLMVFISIVPMLALGTAVVKGLGDEDKSRVEVYRLFDKLLAFDSSKETAHDRSSDERKGNQGQGQNQDPSRDLAQEALSIHLRAAVDKLFDYVDRTNFATLGVAGILGIMIIVIPFFGSLEQSMNAIWQVEKGRPFGLKIIYYLAVMILLPIAINVGLAAMTVLESPGLLGRLKVILPGAWVEPLLLKMVPGTVVVLIFTALYRILPNTKVPGWSAFIGGLFGGIAWILVQALYLKLQIGVARYNAIYGSFATVPLFLLWIYVGWIIFLAGAELSFAIKIWHTYLPKRGVVTGGARLALCIDVLVGVMQFFKKKEIANRENLSRRLRQPENKVGKALRDLLEAGFIRGVEGKESGYVPAGPIEETDMTGLIAMIYGKPGADSQGGRLAEEALEAARSVLAGQDIGRLLEQKGGAVTGE